MVCIETRPRIAGGFVLVPVPRLLHAWRACRVRPLGVGDFRAWLGCYEMVARRCLASGTTHSHSAAELARLLGISERRTVASIRRLVTAGLVVFGTDQIEFPEQNLEAAERIDAIGGGRDSIAVPRRILRMLARGARPALIATVLGILLRCLSRRRRGFESRGRVKSSWIARTFRIEPRRVKEARAELVELGWIEPESGEQWAWNRWGRAFRIDLGWDRPDRLQLAPPPPKIRATLAPPESDPEPLRESKNQEPAPPNGQTGIRIEEQGEPRPEPIVVPVAPAPAPAPVTSPTASGPPELPPPRLDDIRPEDLQDAGRLLELHGQAVSRRLVGSSEGDRLKFVALAEHARSVGRSNPPGLFSALLRRGAWSFITQGEEDSARRKLKAHLWGGSSLPISVPSSSFPLRRELSADARLVREITRTLTSAGYRGDAFPQLRRLDASWTRSRWDVALLELGYLSESSVRR